MSKGLVSALTILMKKTLVKAISVVDGEENYSDEIAATIQFIEDNLEAEGIETCSPWYALFKPNPETTSPMEFTLKQNYPNPFNPTTTIEYSIPQSSHVTLSIYNGSGQRVSVLKDEYQQAGNHSVIFQMAV